MNDLRVSVKCNIVLFGGMSIVSLVGKPPDGPRAPKERNNRDRNQYDQADKHETWFEAKDESARHGAAKQQAGNVCGIAGAPDLQVGGYDATGQPDDEDLDRSRIKCFVELGVTVTS